MPGSRTALLLGTVALLSAAGCESKGTVQGTVTYKGEKLAAGYITFYPVGESGDTKGAMGETRGADIQDGVYKIENLAPGKRKVVIGVSPKLVAAKGADASKSGVKALPPANPIAASARGNSEVFDIRGGDQTLDFALEPK